jgi:hypothetical protein
MATTFKPTYASSAAITITPGALANAAYRQSAAVDNSTNLYADAMIYGKAITASSAMTVNSALFLFLVWSLDAGTTYSNNASGTDAAYTQPDSDSNLVIGGSAIIPAATTTPVYFRPFSFCQAAGLLFLPQKWGVILKNASGVALQSGTHVFVYQGVNMQGI